MQFRDVAADAEHAEQPAIRRMDGRLGDMGQLAMAIGKGQPFLVAARPSGRYGRDVVGTQEIGNLLRQQIMVAAPDDGIGRKAEEACGPGIALQVASVRVLHPDHVGQRVDQRFGLGPGGTEAPLLPVEEQGKKPGGQRDEQPSLQGLQLLQGVGIGSERFNEAIRKEDPEEAEQQVRDDDADNRLPEPAGGFAFTAGHRLQSMSSSE